MAVTPLATGRGAQVVTDPVSDARQAIRGAYASTLEENLAFIADSIAAGDLADGYTPDGTTLTGLDANNYVIANAPIAGGPGGTVDEAPTDGFTYGRRSTAWTLVVPSTGGAYTGPITLPGSPTLAQQATTKSYVDQAIANAQLNQGTWQVAANVPDLNAAIPTNLDGYTWTAQTVDPLVGEVAPAVPGISGRTINAGDTVRWNTALAAYELIQGAGLTQATADQRYVNVAGDTLTGPLVLAADPANPLEAATKQYVDDADVLLDAEKVNLAGDVMTGPLVLPGNPAAALQAAPKQYVDTATALKVSKSGDTMTGILVLSGDPVAALDAATRQYVDAGDAALDAAMVHRAGDAMTGALVLASDPTAALQAATKSYVDTLSANAVQRAGDIMSGNLKLPLAPGPTNPEDATTKQYVDQSIAATSLYQGAWQVAANTPDLTVATPLNGYSWIAQTVDPNVPEVAPAGLAGITAGTLIGAGTTLRWNGNSLQWELIQGGGLTQAVAGTLYVSKTGDTMTGNLTIQNDGQGVLFNGGGRFYKRSGTGLVIREHAGGTQPQIEDNDGSNRRDIIDTINGDARYVNKAGDTMGGGLLFGSTVASGPNDTSRHLTLWGSGSGSSTYGLCVTNNTLNYNTSAVGSFHTFWGAGTQFMMVGPTVTINSPINATVTIQMAGNTQALRLQSTVNTSANDPAVTWMDASGRSTAQLFGSQDGNIVGGNPQGTMNCNTNNGGYGWQKCWTTQVASPPNLLASGDVFARGVKLTSDASLKRDIREAGRDEINAAFAALRPVRYRWGDVTTVDGDVVPCSDQREQFGFVANDLPDELVSEAEGNKHYDMAAVLAIAVGRIKQLEADIAELKGARS